MNHSQTVLLAKAEHYCAYQERSHFEVRMHLLEWGAKGDVLEEILSLLIQHNFLNEERFATTYTRGKFNLKGWGKLKIKQRLKLKQIPSSIIEKALNSIPTDEYEEKLRNILNQKKQTITESNAFKNQHKLTQFALSRGFESSLIYQLLRE